jgi:hypothetical protein
MNITSIIQALTTAVVTYLATKGLKLDSHTQILLAGGLTMVASWVFPPIRAWSHVHAREIGAVLGVVAVAAQIILSLNVSGEVQAITTAVIAAIASLAIPAAAHVNMPAAGASPS